MPKSCNVLSEIIDWIGCDAIPISLARSATCCSSGTVFRYSSICFSVPKASVDVATIGSCLGAANNLYCSGGRIVSWIAFCRFISSISFLSLACSSAAIAAP